MNSIERKTDFGSYEPVDMDQDKKNKPTSIDLLLRRGDLLNPLGILRAARIFDNTLKKADFEAIIQRNYIKDQKTGLSQILRDQINVIWNESITIFAGMDILKHSSADHMELKKPNEIVFFR